mgnify:CR=1 FL=1
MRQTLLLLAVMACGSVLAAPKPAKQFTNTLGMKFVPVRGTKVKFCIWETRVKDYAAYADANAGVDASWKNPGYTQADTHPVVMVNWVDPRGEIPHILRN